MGRYEPSPPSTKELHGEGVGEKEKEDPKPVYAKLLSVEAQNVKIFLSLKVVVVTRTQFAKDRERV